MAPGVGPTSHCYSGAGIGVGVGVGSFAHCHPDETALQRSGEHNPLPCQLTWQTHQPLAELLVQAANTLQPLAELPEEEEEEEEEERAATKEVPVGPKSAVRREQPQHLHAIPVEWS